MYKKKIERKKSKKINARKIFVLPQASVNSAIKTNSNSYVQATRSLSNPKTGEKAIIVKVYSTISGNSSFKAIACTKEFTISQLREICFAKFMISESQQQQGGNKEINQNEYELFIMIEYNQELIIHNHPLPHDELLADIYDMIPILSIEFVQGNLQDCKLSSIQAHSISSSSSSFTSFSSPSSSASTSSHSTSSLQSSSSSNLNQPNVPYTTPLCFYFSQYKKPLDLLIDDDDIPEQQTRNERRSTNSEPLPAASNATNPPSSSSSSTYGRKRSSLSSSGNIITNNSINSSNANESPSISKDSAASLSSPSLATDLPAPITAPPLPDMLHARSEE